VLTVAADVAADAATFVVLVGGAVLLEEGPRGTDVSPLVAAVELEPPYRCEAVRRAPGLWALGARRIETVVLGDDPGGDEIELAFDGAERSVRIDGAPTLAGIPVLEELGARQGTAYVVTATRLDGTMWEVAAAAL
jgi:hypothetical protein